MTISDEMYLKSTNTAEEFIHQFMKCLDFENYSIQKVNDRGTLVVSEPEGFTLYVSDVDQELNEQFIEDLSFTPTLDCSFDLKKFGDILRVKHELITAIIKYTRLIADDVLAYTDGDSEVIIYYNQNLTLRENHWIWKDYPFDKMDYTYGKLPNL